MTRKLLFLIAFLVMICTLLYRTGILRYSTKEIHFTEAGEYVGEDLRVKGELDHVHRSREGNIFLNFCEDYRECPFSGVIFERHGEENLKSVVEDWGEGTVISVRGVLSLYRGRPQIIIKEEKQLNCHENCSGQ